MKVRSPNRNVKYLTLVCCLVIASCAKSDSKLLTKKEALDVALKTEEAKAFYALDFLKNKRCVEKRVERPCDSDWVTCIEEAWVVHFVLEKTCFGPHDERLSLNLLIDSKTGEVISRFPEVEYLKTKDYCLESYDCSLSFDEKDRASCLNFIHTPFSEVKKNTDKTCQCSQNQCILVIEKDV